VTIKKLKIFYEVARELNMTSVANKLYISQSAISQSIHEMEEMLGVKLFNRIGKRLYLTSEGAVYLNYTRRILNLYEESVNVISDLNNLEKGSLKIGASTTIGIYVLPEIIDKFSKKHQTIDLFITIENTQNIAEMIMENKIDLAFVEGPVHSDEIIVENIWKDELIFIMPLSQKWNDIEYVNEFNLKDEKMILREKGSGTRKIFEKAMKDNDIPFTITFELGNTEAIKRAVVAGMGISCLSERAVKDEIQCGKLLSRRLKNIKIERYFNLIYHKDKYISKLFREFIEFARKCN